MQKQNKDFSKYHILIDADDTLWENGLHYREVEDAYVKLLSEEGYDAIEVRELVRTTDMKRVKIVGFGAIPYFTTLFKVYKMLSGISEKPETVREIGVLRDKLLNHPIDFLKGVEDSVKELASLGFNIYIYTRGEFTNQEDKILKSGLLPHLRGRFIVPDKTPEILKDIISIIYNPVEPKEYPKAANEKFHQSVRTPGIIPGIEEQICLSDIDIEKNIKYIWVIGNSPAGDINPALELGIKSILVRYYDTWEIDEADIDDSEHFFKAEDFYKIPDILTSRSEK